MKESRIADMARKATQAATARTGELTQFVATTADTVKSLTADATDQLSDVTTDMKEAALVRLRESLEDFNVGLMPDIVLTFGPSGGAPAVVTPEPKALPAEA